MVTIPELRKKLADVELKEKYWEGLAEKRRLQKEIFTRSHPHIISSGKKIKSVGKTITSNVKSMAKVAYEAGRGSSKKVGSIQKGHYYKKVGNKFIKVKTKRTRRNRGFVRQRRVNNPFDLGF